MIPHHLIAILTSENSELRDVRVCELATKIIKAQKHKISEMQWLIDDISKNGSSTTKAQVYGCKVPEFQLKTEKKMLSIGLFN